MRKIITKIRGYSKVMKRRMVRLTRKAINIPGDGLDPFRKNNYALWIEIHEIIPRYYKLEYEPLFSIFIITHTTKKNLLSYTMNSICNQKYNKVEIFLVENPKKDNEGERIVRKNDDGSEIKIKKDKDFLKYASGDFIIVIDEGDIFSENSLYEVAEKLNEDKEIDFIYSDEDKIDKNDRRYDPHFKPDWSPDTLLSWNYIGHLAVIRKKLVDEVGGMRPKFGEMCDYDLYLRVTEKTDRICHIPKVLYHARDLVKSDEEMQIEIDEGKEVLCDTLERREIKGEIYNIDNEPFYCIKYAITGNPKVSIIIPTRDGAKILRRCLDSIFEKTSYSNFEVIVMNNNSVEKETLELFEGYVKKYSNFRVIDANYDFNYSKINNQAVEASKGQYIVLLNNDTEIISSDWLEVMLGYASQKHIGVVGPQLLYPDDTVQHGGTVLGLGVASHVFVGEKSDAKIWGRRLSVPYDYSSITAACFMVSRKKWNEVGGLEEELRVAYNDVDFCLKLLEKGYYNVFVPMVKVYHHESRTRGADDTPEKKKRFDEEQLFMYRKWARRIERDAFYNPNFSRLKAYRLDKEKIKIELPK